MKPVSVWLCFPRQQKQNSRNEGLIPQEAGAQPQGMRASFHGTKYVHRNSAVHTALTFRESVEISKEVRLLPLLLADPHFLLRAGLSLEVSLSSLVLDSSALAVSLLAAVSDCTIIHDHGFSHLRMST